MTYLERLAQCGKAARPEECPVPLHVSVQAEGKAPAVETPATAAPDPAERESAPAPAGEGTAGPERAALISFLSALRDRIQRGVDRGEDAAAVLCDLAGTVAAKLAAVTDGPPSALSSWVSSARAFYLDTAARQSTLYGQAVDTLETKQERARADTLAKLRRRIDTQQRALAAIQYQTGKQSDLLAALESGDLETAEKALAALRR